MRGAPSPPTAPHLAVTSSPSRSKAVFGRGRGRRAAADVKQPGVRRAKAEATAAVHPTGFTQDPWRRLALALVFRRGAFSECTVEASLPPKKSVGCLWPYARAKGAVPLYGKDGNRRPPRRTEFQTSKAPSVRPAERPVAIVATIPKATPFSIKAKTPQECARASRLRRFPCSRLETCAGRGGVPRRAKSRTSLVLHRCPRKHKAANGQTKPSKKTGWNIEASVTPDGATSMLVVVRPPPTGGCRRWAIKRHCTSALPETTHQCGVLLLSYF